MFKDLPDLITKRLNYNQQAVKQILFESMIFSDQNKVNEHYILHHDFHSRHLEKQNKKNSKQIYVKDKNPFQMKKISNYNIIQDLVIEYKLSLQYGPSLGIYAVPEVSNFFKWQFYLFIRQGYFKDAKLKGQIQFDSLNAIKIKQLRFISPVFHPFVEFQNGSIDLKKITVNSSQNCLDLFALFSTLKEMFLNEKYLLVKDSFNPEASKTYQKSQTLFIQKIFQTTIIPSEQNNVQHNEDTTFKHDLNILQTSINQKKDLKLFKEKLKHRCSNSFRSFELKSQIQNKENYESMQQKTERYLEIIMSGQLA